MMVGANLSSSSPLPSLHQCCCLQYLTEEGNYDTQPSNWQPQRLNDCCLWRVTTSLYADDDDGMIWLDRSVHLVVVVWFDEMIIMF